MSVAMIKEINDAIGAHGAWKLKLRTAISVGKSDVEPATVRCDDRCALGRWLYGSTLDDSTKSGKPYQVIRRLHAEFHHSAATVLESALAGRKDQATQALEGEFKERSEKLVRALTKWKGELLNSSSPGAAG